MSIFKTFFEAENKFWLRNSVQKHFYIYFEIQAGKADPKGDRIPLNISLVVDRSGSMSGDKLNFVKKAVGFVIDNLNSGDSISVVQYDDVVEIVSPSGKVMSKKELHEKVKRIEAGGMTNLSGGMLEGYSQVEKTKEEKFVNRVLLLSDGLANEGITDPEKLKQIVQRKFRELGIGLSTFGVGADFNELLMTHLSEFGGGNYYFIESPEMIPGIFADELKGLLSVVSQSTKLEIAFPSGYFGCSYVYGYPFETRGDKIFVNFNDVVSEEKKAVLIRFDVLKVPDKELNFSVNLIYEDVLDTLGKIVEEQTLNLGLTEDESEFNKNTSVRVIEQVVYFTANRMFEEAIDKSDKRDLEGARKLVKQAKEFIETHFKSHGQTEELIKLHEYLLDYEKRLGEMEFMSQHDYLMTQKTGRSLQYLTKRKK